MRGQGVLVVPGLSRRTIVASFVMAAVMLLRVAGRQGEAQPATPVALLEPDLLQLFPADHDLPAGLELESSGTREEIAQLAGTFRNSRDAAQLLASWGWVGNAYRSYSARAGAGRSVPARVEISVHQFRTRIGAAYALSYFAHDHAVAFRHHERLDELLLPCAAMVTGKGYATRFLRLGTFLVRVTVVMPASADAEADTTALTMATELALAVLAKAGAASSPPNATC